MSLDLDFWRGKRVLLTGHTGFKGAWMYQWLRLMGADVVGFALAPQTNPNLYDLLNLGNEKSCIGDLRDLGAVQSVVAQHQPEVVLHLAAQALVRKSYRDPLESFSTNVMGTANLLEALRDCPSLEAVLVVTSDKAYENDERAVPFHEGNALGGKDPYSASKGCQEIVTHSYARSFFSGKSIPVATARAGNVIGGGDWSEDRLMTDVISALYREEEVVLRNPLATRPWQHVLEPLGGYLLFVQKLAKKEISLPALNFGPNGSASVQTVVEEVCRLWGDGRRWVQDEADQPAEAHALALDITLAAEELGWHPLLGFEETLQWIVSWHKTHKDGGDVKRMTLSQITTFQSLLAGS
ncbi:CDP-glucose 4,6-dehydratase [Kiloniella laminariae]|uniref:CDP-glucose 4,6-dehydratase n=1 Tax=Kiloniella laminariae TaxID=454162 RepID=A0ABT4LEP1_9PROT|nr:CDP-glucose 4,6-dehydratase [Kiloniella laminariae]MCZ4279390.1 CDP-glucose 4,6-dehydratase [Kiloniella laminariae]